MITPGKAHSRGERFGLVFLLALILACGQERQEATDTPSPDPSATTEDRPGDCPVVRIGDRYIYFSDLLRASEEDEERLVPVPGIPREKLIFRTRYEKLDRLVVRETLRQEAEEMGIVITDEEVEEWIQAAGPWASSETLGSFYPWLRDLPPDRFRKELKVDMMVVKAARQRMGELNPVTENEVRNFYDENRTTLGPPPEVKAFVILIKKEGRTRDEAIGKIKAIRSSLEVDLAQAEDWEAKTRAFADYARLYSEHHASDMGGYWVVRHVEDDEEYTQFEKIAREIPLRTLSDVHEMNSGFFITMVESRREREIPSFEEVSEQIRRLLIYRRNENAQQGLYETLKEEYRPQVFRENILGCGVGVP